MNFIFSFNHLFNTDKFSQNLTIQSDELSYIGKSKRPLVKRITEHQQNSRKTTICSHISECPLYLEELKKQYGTIPSRNTVKFLSERFEIIHKNLYYDKDRKIMEALLISFRKPTLNAQVKHEYVGLTQNRAFKFSVFLALFSYFLLNVLELLLLFKNIFLICYSGVRRIVIRV